MLSLKALEKIIFCPLELSRWAVCTVNVMQVAAGLCGIAAGLCGIATGRESPELITVC